MSQELNQKKIIKIFGKNKKYLAKDKRKDFYIKRKDIIMRKKETTFYPNEIYSAVHIL